MAITSSETEIDINVLVRIYNQKISALTNQNVILEAKMQTLENDFIEQKNKFIEENNQLKNKISELTEDKENF